MAALRKKNVYAGRLKGDALYECISSERGQASAEYVIALFFVGLVVVAALFGLFNYFSSAGSTSGSHNAKIYSRAPYTLPRQGAVSEQWAKDIIVH